MQNTDYTTQKYLFKHTDLHFIPICRIEEVYVVRNKSRDDCRVIHEELLEEKVLTECKCTNENDNINCINDQRLYTIRVITKSDRIEKYIVHPSENEHMERYLAGTDDPMYDFVHELRYHPDSLLGREKEGAESHFKKHRVDNNE